MAAARSKLLQAGLQLCRLGKSIDGLPRQLGGLAGALGTPGAQQAAGLQRCFSSEPDAQVQDAAAGLSKAAPRDSGASSGTRLARHLRNSKLFVPIAWENQGAAEADHPLVKELHALVNANNAEGARRSFEEALAPLEAQLAQGETPDAADVPPPFAWKLYFISLAACNAHPFRLNGRLLLMQRLGVPPQAACFVTTLKCMAKQGLGWQAYTTLREMKDLGLEPTLRSYLFTINATLRQRPPELGYAHKLLVEVEERGVVQYGSHRVQMGKYLLQAAREFARYRRFHHAFHALDQLEALGLRVPAFVLADITQLATVAEDPEHLMECVRRLEQATQTYHPAADAEPVTRPLKVEEGLLLNVLQVAANKGHVPLAEASWQVLERSVALHNTPGPSLLRYSKGPEAQQPEAAGEAADGAPVALGAEGDALESEVVLASDEEEAAAEAARQQAAADSRQLEAASEQLEASDSAAAERADSADNYELLQRAARRGVHAPHAWTAESSAAEVASMAAEQRGVRKPSPLSYLALIHTYAKAQQDEAMLQAVHKLLEDLPEQQEEDLPEQQEEAAYHAALHMAVDSLARSVPACDAAFDLLETWAAEGLPVFVQQLNLVVAAYSQIGDLKRAFGMVDAYPRLGVEADADTYNALMEGCLASGRVSTAMDVHGTMKGAGQEGNERTYELLVEAGIVSGDVDAMMTALQDLEAAGYSPSPRLLERCVSRAERAGDRDALHQLLKQLFDQDYRIVGVDAKARRWEVEGGMPALTGTSHFVSREEVGFALRKDKAIATRQQAMASESTTSRLALVALTSAAAGSLLTYATLRRRKSGAPQQQQPAAEGGAALAQSEELQRQDPQDPSPRKGYLSWDDYFMAVAFLSAQRSKDPNKQVGACIVDANNVICGIGYNGFPRGCADSQLPWAKRAASGDPLDTKYPYVCHAEMNALLNKNGASVAGARVYVTMFPCNECAKLMIQAGIKEVVYHEAKGEARRSDSPITGGNFNRDQQYAASQRLLALAGVRLRQHLFRQPVLLRLTNDAQRPATVLRVEAAPFTLPAAGSGNTGGGSAGGGGKGRAGKAAAAAAAPAPVAPALAAVLENGSHAGTADSAEEAPAVDAVVQATSKGSGAAAGGASAPAGGQRRRGRRHPTARKQQQGEQGQGAQQQVGEAAAPPQQAETSAAPTASAVQ
ncbi:Deoxycytidylate deaminase isoform A [Chlorella sorokiniana]|uniref:dCMP deaminase n=1 Tax=Chlorella sorokiniana TaxID=3076 RepID=A0A2P6TL36_CHLSO|nr:Deoxycytidylate deaminase isoform A [Chlorella sorokiniana]|eukprot:PRW45007.1 Deoxycytidylate deaminase isoform A [Chlorella sorokiniana]